MEIAEADLAAIKAGVDRAAADIAAARAAAVQARAFHARQSQLFSEKAISANEFDQTTPQRDVAVKELPSIWAVGQRAKVYIQTAPKDQALLVPQAAVTWRMDHAGVFVNHAGHAEWRNVTLGLRGESGTSKSPMV